MQTKKLRASAVAWLLLVPVFVGLFCIGDVAAAPSPALDETSWTKGTIYSDTDVRFNVNAVMDSDGNFHISYLSENKLMYATNLGGEWKTEIVDGVHHVQKYSDIAVDSNGTVHISYFVSNNSGQLYYAVGSFGNWVKTVLSDETTVGTFNSIAIDAEGNVHIVYFHDGDDRLIYATDKGGVWNFTTIVDIAIFGTAITTDDECDPHVAYLDQANKVVYAHLSSGSWVTTSIDDADNQWAAVDIDLIGGNVCVTYSGESHELMYAQLSNVGLWSEQTVYNSTSSIICMSMSIDSSNGVHIAFCTSEGLDYATYDGSWSISRLDETTGFYASIVSDYNDKQHVIYLDEGSLTCSIGYITNSGASWLIDNIDDVAVEDQTSSIVVDGNGNVHIAYYDSYTANNTSYGRLCYANNVDGWEYEIVDNSTDFVGLYPSITLDENGAVHICYQSIQSDQETLKYATNADGSWFTTTLDGAGNVANCSSICVYDDTVYVAYLSQANTLKFIIFEDGDVKRLESIDSDILTTDRISMAVNSTGVPYVAYYQDQELNLAHLYNTTWVLGSIESTSQLGGGISMYIDGQDNTYITYCDTGLGLLKYISDASGNWSVPVIIDSDGEVTDANAITVDENGDEHITYVDDTGDGELKCAEMRDGIWMYQKIDLDSCGSIISVAMDSEGRSHISYFNESGGLMYATSVTIPSAPTNLTVTVHNAYLTLNWVASVNDGGMDLIEYQIYRSNGTSGYTLLDTVSPSITEFNDSTVTNGQNYTYKVKTVNSEGSSLFSNTASGIPCTRPGATDPDADASDGSVKLSWSEPDNGGGEITSYKIYRRAEGEANYSLLATVDGDVTSYTDKSVENGVEYSYYIVATNPAGAGPESSSVTATPSASFDMMIIIVIVVVVLAVAGVGVFMFLKRQGKIGRK